MRRRLRMSRVMSGTGLDLARIEDLQTSTPTLSIGRLGTSQVMELRREAGSVSQEVLFSRRDGSWVATNVETTTPGLSKRFRTVLAIGGAVLWTLASRLLVQAFTGIGVAVFDIVAVLGVASVLGGYAAMDDTRVHRQPLWGLLDLERICGRLEEVVRDAELGVDPEPELRAVWKLVEDNAWRSPHPPASPGPSQGLIQVQAKKSIQSARSQHIDPAADWQQPSFDTDRP